MQPRMLSLPVGAANSESVEDIDALALLCYWELGARKAAYPCQTKIAGSNEIAADRSGGFQPPSNRPLELFP